jgi:mitofilin
VGESSVASKKINPLAGGKPHPPASIDDVGESRAMSGNGDPLATLKTKPTATIDDVGESQAIQDAKNIPPPPPPSPPKQKKGFFRRLRNFVFTLMVLGAVGFGGGVWYSRINDNFHDFFTEFVPFGEQAVLYFEEAEFRKKFPHVTNTGKSRESGESVRIPAQSGASWRVADSSESSTRHSSASPKKQSGASPKTSAEPTQTGSPVPPAKEPVAQPAKSVERTAPETDQIKDQKPKAASVKKPAPTKEEFKAPEVNEPSRFPPLEPIDLMKLSDAKEPVVQDIVHMLNDLILVINADGAHGKYSTTIDKAKSEVAKVGQKLKEMKGRVERKAAGEVKNRISEFDKAATELVDRVEKAMVAQELQWRQEFEEEMKTVRNSYDERVRLLMEREKKLNEEKLKNQLLEQAINLKKEFVDEVKDRVEKEREGRLSKLNDLSSAVSDLEKLTLGWNEVVDTNLKTQQLHVAVEAVRASLEESSTPRPFTQELVALKEIASDSPVVNAAIASVNPSAYQRGVPSSSQLIDRFRRVAGEVRKASLLPDEAGVASHASSWALSHLMFKKQGLAEGSDVESILTRTQTYLEEGDLDAAAREMNGLKGWARTLSKDWLSEVRKVLEVQQALDVSFRLPLLFQLTTNMIAP